MIMCCISCLQSSNASRAVNDHEPYNPPYPGWLASDAESARFHEGGARAESQQPVGSKLFVRHVIVIDAFAEG